MTSHQSPRTGAAARHRRRSGYAVTAATVALSVFLLTGCGASSNASGDSPTTKASGESLQEATPLVKQASGAVPFPKLEQTAVSPGKKLFVISPSQSLEGNARMAKGALDAAKLIGWSTVLVDAQFDPVKEAAGVQRAISEKADGIVLVAMDTAPISSALKAARAANIPVVSIVSGGKQGELVDDDVTFDQRQSGKIAASQMIVEAKGDVHSLVLDDTSQPLVKPIVDGVSETLKHCSTCSIEQQVNFVSSQVGPNLTSLVQSALARHPDTNYIFTPYGAVAVYAAKAVENLGSHAKIVSTASDLVNYDLIRKGQVQSASVDQPAAYDGYVAVYQINRILQHLKPATIAVPIKLITRSNVPGEGAVWEGDDDYVSEFKAAFGLS